MTQYQVDSEAVFTATTAVRATSGRIEAEVSGLLGQLTQLQGSWTGQAATAFQAIITDWHATQQRVEENLATINQALTLAAQQYVETEQANMRLFNH